MLLVYGPPLLSHRLMLSLLSFRGELAALSAAVIWAFASVIYTRVGKQLSPLLLNLVKGLIAIALLLITLQFRHALFPTVSPTAVGWLLLSGAIGIGVGDTAYFQALNDIGPRRTLILESLSPALSAGCAWLFLQERLPLSAGLGIGLTIAGIMLVVSEGGRDRPEPRHQWQRGVLCGLVAALGQAGGAVLSRAAVGGSTIDPLWSTLIRLLAGVGILLIGLLVQQRWQHPSGPVLPPALQSLRSPRFFSLVASTAFASTYLGIWLQQISLKYTATGIAQALSSTSPLFVTAIALSLGEKVSARAIAGVLTAMAGIWLLFIRQG
jgi:drug/metabolite transporter (DMT)-like permease